MKRAIVCTILFLNLVLSCKSSQSKTQLVAENKALKERIKTLESYDIMYTKAALELKNMNVVYRGVSNPIYISKQNVLSFEASAPGLKKIDSFGNYVLSPRTGKTVDIKIKSKLKNGDSLIENKILKIKDIGRIIGLINGNSCNSKCQLLLTVEELKNSIVGLGGDNFVFNLDLSVKGFKLKLPDSDVIEVVGNNIPIKMNNQIEQLKPNDIVYIFDIKLKINNSNFYSLRICKTPLIQIRIIEQP
ncbi:GldM family protein [Winogradskyella eximia]|uniref:GldM family protein n=1 Tax=Winogradskyella eximia TaxID=262006 RepID=UPI0024913AFA|nr:GldM family protein [Winogradskyella eximia]